MSSCNLYNRFRTVMPQFQLPEPVDTKETSQYLPHIVKHISVCFDVIALRINRKPLRTIRKGFYLFTSLSKLHAVGFTAQVDEIICRAHSLKSVEILLELQHEIIRLQFQTLHRPVNLRHLI